MLLARLMAIVSSAASSLAAVPAASSCSIDITPTLMITVTIAASMRVKPRRRRGAARAGLVTWSVIHDRYLICPGAGQLVPVRRAGPAARAGRVTGPASGAIRYRAWRGRRSTARLQAGLRQGVGGQERRE